MQLAHRHLIRHAIRTGHTVSVHDGEEWAAKRSRSSAEAIAAVESVEQAELIIRDAEGNRIAWALVIPFGVDADETVADYSANRWMSDWEHEYNPHDSSRMTLTPSSLSDLI